MDERLVKGAGNSAAAFPTQKRSEPAVVRRIVESHVQLARHGATFDSKLEAPAQRIGANQREPMVRDQAVDFVKLFFFPGQPRTNDELAPDADLGMRVRAADAAEAGKPNGPFLDRTEKYVGVLCGTVKAKTRAMRLQSRSNCIVGEDHSKAYSVGWGIVSFCKNIHAALWILMNGIHHPQPR